MVQYIMMCTEVRYLIGVDEAGRGPIAGPVAVGGVCIAADFDWAFFYGIRDSKKLSAQKREAWFAKLRDMKRRGEAEYAVSLVKHSVIDRRGIRFAVSLAISRVLGKLSPSPEETLVLLDGSLFAPREFLYQKTIIRGDESEPIISLASIAAKVMRDRTMERLSLKYPEWDFAQHKGYGTKEHFRRIRRYGISAIHRKSFFGLD